MTTPKGFVVFATRGDGWWLEVYQQHGFYGCDISVTGDVGSDAWWKQHRQAERAFYDGPWLASNHQWRLASAERERRERAEEAAREQVREKSRAERAGQRRPRRSLTMVDRPAPATFHLEDVGSVSTLCGAAPPVSWTAWYRHAPSEMDLIPTDARYRGTRPPLSGL